MPRLMSFTKTWEAFKDGSKTVTRRSRLTRRSSLVSPSWAPGWQSIKAGDIIEGVEWTPRWAPNGGRWTCLRCGWLGHTDPTMTISLHFDLEAVHHKDSPSCTGIVPMWRGPERLPGTEGHRRIVSVRDEFLYDITQEDVVLEGFTGLTPCGFHFEYCGGKSISNRPVNRIEFENL